ncbi:hypothetical protein [Bremerella sp. P1]|uniref:hypothetical protein n=1 Tax=Bremerella sp. P1 TaxID=3026424 RepID=UPI0023684C5E|nr:hypothetical protein [Bremerella sp. P1]WDI43371.1 hypothetical protein PSR63_05355 [Bremerella sp. P1]
MLSLEQRIELIELESIRQFAGSVGVSMEDFATQVLEEHRRQAKRRLSVLESTEGIPKVLRDWETQHYRSVIESDSLLDWTRSGTAGKRILIDSTLNGFFTELGEDYWSSIFDPPPVEDGEPPTTVVGGLLELISKVRSVNLFERQMNAFFSPSLGILGVPVVCVYPQLEKTIDLVANLLCYCFVQLEDYATEPDRIEDKLKRIARRDDIRFVTREVVRLARCETIGGIVYPTCTASGETADFRSLLEYRLLALAAIQFVWFHEFGHVLLGHTGQGPSKEFELQADAFALAVLMFQSGGLDETRPIVGVTLCLLIIALTEDSITEQDSHPPARYRLRQLFNGMSVRNQFKVESMIRVWKHLFRNALEQRGMNIDQLIPDEVA